MANKGTTCATVSDHTTKGEAWIIDYGASDHMTCNKKLFISYKPRPGTHKIKIADGSFIVVVCT